MQCSCNCICDLLTLLRDVFWKILITVQTCKYGHSKYWEEVTLIASIPYLLKLTPRSIIWKIFGDINGDVIIIQNNCGLYFE